MEDAAKGRLYIPFAASFYVIGKCVLRQKKRSTGIAMRRKGIFICALVGLCYTVFKGKKQPPTIANS